MEKAKFFLSGRRGRNAIYYSQVTRKALPSRRYQPERTENIHLPPEPRAASTESREDLTHGDHQEEGTRPANSSKDGEHSRKDRVSHQI